MDIRKLTPHDFDNVVNTFGEEIILFNILTFEENSCTLGAFKDKRLVGIIAAKPRQLIKPLDAYQDLFITYINVLKEHRNQGIATELIRTVENFAKQQGFFQITAWSNENTIEMNHLALKLKYSMCQAFMYDENYLPKRPDDHIKGYYYGKRLD